MGQALPRVGVEKSDLNYFLVVTWGPFALRMGGRPAMVVAFGIPQTLFSFLATTAANTSPAWLVPTMLILSLVSFVGLAGYWIKRQQ